MECTVLKRGTTLTFGLYLGIFSLWLGLCVNARGQTTEKRYDEINLAETGLMVKTEDGEKARQKAEEVKAHADKTINELEAFISNLENDTANTTLYHKELQQGKKVYQAGEVNPAFVKLLEKELKFVKQNINVNNEQIKVYKDYIIALQNQSRVYTTWFTLLDSAATLAEIVAETPSGQATTVRKEANIAKSYIPAAQANLKEKETLVSFLTKELEDVKVRTYDKEKEIAQDLELLTAEIKDSELMKKAMGIRR